MFTSKSIITTVLTVLIAFAVQTIAAPSAHAKWHDNSDDLPGMHEFPTGLAIVGGLVVVGCIVYMVSKKKSDKKKTEQVEDDRDQSTDEEASTVEPSESDSDATQSSAALTPTFEQPHGSALGFYFDVDFDRPVAPHKIETRTPDLSDATVKLGVSLGF